MSVIELAHGGLEAGEDLSIVALRHHTLDADDPVITLDVVRRYVARRGEESETTRAHRLSLIRQVCRFLALEQPRTTVPAPRFLAIHRRTFVARVMSQEDGHGYSVELTRICGFRFQPEAVDDGGGEELPNDLAATIKGASGGQEAHVVISPWPKDSM